MEDLGADISSESEDYYVEMDIIDTLMYSLREHYTNGILDCLNNTQPLFDALRSNIKESTPTVEALSVVLVKKLGSFFISDPTGSGCENILELLHIAVSQRLVGTAGKLIQLFLLCIRQKNLQNLHQLQGKSFDLLSMICYKALTNGSMQIVGHLSVSRLMDIREYPNALVTCISCGQYGADLSKMLSWLVTDWGFDPKGDSGFQCKPIHKAVSMLDTAAVETLIQHGVDANHAEDFEINTPLHHHLKELLCKKETDPLSAEMVEMLIAHGADLFAKNRFGHTAVSAIFALAGRTRDENDTLKLINHINRVQFYNFVDLTPRVADERKDELFSFYAKDPPMRTFFLKLVNKFGLALLPNGAKLLLDKPTWDSIEEKTEKAGASLNHVPSLQNFCWVTVRRALGGKHFQHKVDQLPVPDRVKRFFKEL
ncbi:hypothetical protein ACOMHN_037825 [Nucella lapillus]